MLKVNTDPLTGSYRNIKFETPLPVSQNGFANTVTSTNSNVLKATTF